jgi:hypothetical protein
MVTRICIDCKEELDSSKFNFRKFKTRIDFKTRCKKCHKIHHYEVMKKRRETFELRVRERELDLIRRQKNPEKEILRRAKKRALKENLPFNLELSDIIIPKNCPILNIPLKLNSISAGDDSPSLDKIDPLKGYVKGNVKVISRLANIMKAHASVEQLMLFRKNIKKYLSPV